MFQSGFTSLSRQSHKEDTNGTQDYRQRCQLSTGSGLSAGFRVDALAPGALLAVLALVGACDDDTGMNPQNEETMFEVRVENVSAAFDFTSTGVFNTPAGSDGPGPLLPGNSYEFSFSGGPGSAVSFATMFVQSNDLFYAPGGEGIPVFDQTGTPLSGDITDQIYLWDAGPR